ncbi:MAG: hypothetical protein ACK4GG_00810 [Sphingomonas sp.]
MASLNPPRFGLFGPKPINAKGTAKAFAAGDRVFKRTGVPDNLKRIVQLSLVNDKKIVG